MTVADLRKLVADLAPHSLIPREWLLGRLDEVGSEPMGTPLVDLTAGQAGELLGRSSSTIREYCRAGLFPGAYKMRGREWRVPRDAIREFQRVEAEAMTPPPTAKRRGGEEVDLGAWRKEFE